MDRADDESLLKRAMELSRVVFTQDLDFFAIARSWMEVGRDVAGVICARQMGITIGEAIRDLELMAVLLEPEEMQNRVEWIPL